MFTSCRLVKNVQTETSPVLRLAVTDVQPTVEATEPHPTVRMAQVARRRLAHVSELPRTLRAMTKTICLILAIIFISIPSIAGAAPNFVMIVMDDIGMADVGAFSGRPGLATPSIDQIAAEGTTYLTFYGQSLCTPFRDALLTGRHPQRNGLITALDINNTAGVRPEDVLLPEVLKAAGYRTALIGKWHLGHAGELATPPETIADEQYPLNNGFDVFYGMRGGQINSYMTHETVNKTIDWWDGFNQNLASEYSTTAITDHAIQFLDDSITSQPFFLYVAYNAPHYPVQMPGDPYGFANAAHYNNVVGIMDGGIGQIVSKVQELGISANTYVIISGDNGAPPAHMVPWRGGKGSVYEGGIRVPLVIWQDGQVHRVDQQPRIAQDIFPWMARLAGTTVPSNLDGRDFTATGPRDLFWWQDANRAMRRADWKLVMLGPKPELYNLARDPHETRNVARANPKTLKAMRAALAAWQQAVVR